MLISNRKVSIPFVADAKMPIFWPGSKKLWFFTPNMRFHWEKLNGWSDKLKFLSLLDQNIRKKMTKILSLSVKPFMVKELFEIIKYFRRVTSAIQDICVQGERDQLQARCLSKNGEYTPKCSHSPFLGSWSCAASWSNCEVIFY